MKARFTPEIALRLLAHAAATRLEFSGFGFCRRNSEGDLEIYDFVLLDVGNEGYTEIDPKKILPLMEREDRANMKVWIHKHPVAGWSSRDLQTILREPLGSTPEAAGWSVSIVITPVGWIGRIDNYVKGITKELEIEPDVSGAFLAIRALEHEKWEREHPSQPPFRSGGMGGSPAGEVLERSVPDGSKDWDEEDEDDWDDETEDDWDEEDEYDEPEPVLVSTRFRVLEELASYRHFEPSSTALATVLEHFGIDWEEIRKQKGLSE